MCKQLTYSKLPISFLMLLAASFDAEALESVATANSLADLSLLELMSVEVTSISKRPERLSHTPSAIQVILAEHIDRSGATNIPQALRLASNLNVAQQNSYDWVVSSRGFSSDVGNKLLVMFDGRSVYTPLFSGVFWNRQDYLLEDLERIEVVSGPGGTIWGANAVNGVINIVSKSASETQGWYSEAAVGSALENLAGLRYGGRIGEGHYRVYGKYVNHDKGYRSDGSAGSDAWNMGQFGFRTDYQLSPVDSMTLQGDYYANHTMVSTEDESDSKGGNLLGRWVHHYNSDSDLNVQVYYDRTVLNLAVPETIINGDEIAPRGVFRDTLETLDLELSHRFNIGTRQRLVWGIEYRNTYDRTENAPGLGFYPEKLSQNLYAAFIQNEIEIVDEVFSVTMGTKLEHNDYTEYEWEPSIRFRWTLDDNNMLWGAISRAVRSPSRIDRDFSLPTPPSTVILRGDENFESEKVLAYEIGYRAHVSDKVLASIALFYNEYSDVRSTNITPETILPFYFANGLEGETQGFELNVNIQATAWWQLRIGYNYLHENLRVKDGHYDFNNALNETADPENQVSVRSSVDLGDHLEFDLGFRWVDRLPTNDAGELTYVDSYAELDVRLAWRPWDELTLSLVGQNLLSQHHQEFGEPSASQEEVGRNVYAKAEWHF